MIRARQEISKRLIICNGEARQLPIVYVHGIGRQSPLDQLKREWDLALFGRDMGNRTRMAYWSDILHGGPDSARSKKQQNAKEIDLDALLVQARVDVTDKKAWLLTRALLCTMGAATPGVRAKVLPLPAFLRKPITRAFLEALIMDTAAYFFRPGIRTEIQQRLRDCLPPAGEPLILVAHSQGSIIALEVLAGIQAKKQVEDLITIGSPLGIREIQDLLTIKSLCVPGSVAAWHNFADPLDPVALDKGLGNDFEPGGFILDVLIQNVHSRRMEGFNPHSAAGYLAHPKVRQAVYAASQTDSHAPFLVARDVAECLAVEDRHPVLIEILEPGYLPLAQRLNEEPKPEGAAADSEASLAVRIAQAAEKIEDIVGDKNRDAARIDKLRRFVAARLTPAELNQIARQYRELRIYAVWKSSIKRKLISRSARVVQVDAARESYAALGEGITWAVLDTGIRSDHPHFATHRTISAIWDCTQPGPPRPVPDDCDPDGHGTHVAGIIAGASGEEFELEGMAPLARLVIYKVLDNRGCGEDAWIIKALDHIAAQNENSSGILIHGVNLSLGGPYDSTVYGCGFTPLCAELRRLWRNGVLVCVAGGNEGQVAVSTPDGVMDLNSPMSIGDPANLDDCIAVGSVNADQPHLYGVSSFSSRGPTSDGRLKPDVVAPGERIISCNSVYDVRTPKKLYRVESGTSMATPHVSGLLAAFLSVRREFRGRPDEVKAILLRTCTDIRRDRYHQGHGIPNLMRMLLET